jgi:hypothetical protein
VDRFSAGRHGANGGLLEQDIERFALAVVERAEYLVLDR